MGRRVMILAALMAALSCLVAAAAQARVVVDSHTGKRFGIVPAAGAAVAPLRTSCFTDCAAMTLHSGGVVQHAQRDYLLFWDPSSGLPSGYKSGLQSWLNDLAGADYSAGNPVSLTQQYYDKTGSGGSKRFVPYAVQNAGTIIDTDSYPTSGCSLTGYSTCLTDDQIQAELSSYISNHSLPTGTGVQYFVFTPSGVASCFDSSSGTCSYTDYCGYHNNFTSGSSTVLYADMPYLVSGIGCGDAPALNSGGIDTVVGVFSHELAETMTDPLLDAWYDGSGNEIGDKCAYTYGTLSTHNGLSYNVQLGSDYYYIQQEFDNRTLDCQTTNTDTQPTGSISVNTSPVEVGSAASFTANVTDSAGVAYVQWQFGDGSTGSGTSASHTYSAAGGQTVTAIVTDNHGNEVKLGTTITVQSLPVNLSGPTISGSAVAGHVLTESNGSWSGATLPLTYQWQRCDTSGAACSDISGATGQSYTVVSPDDTGHTIRVQETATNTFGSTTTPSPPTAVAVDGVPAAQGAAPSISGTTRQGQTLNESHGDWSEYPTDYSISWQDCDSSGLNCSTVATGSTYTLSAADVGHTVRVLEQASNPAGSASSQLPSAPTGVVLPLAPATTLAPTISGSARQGQTLTELPGSWSNGTTGFSYRWQDCDSAGHSCSDIPGATGQSYVLGAGDVGRTVRVVETAMNAGGTGTASSAATSTVLPLAPVDATGPGISGEARQGSTLAELHGNWSNGVTGFSYQWTACDAAGNNCSAIGGATGQSYTLRASDVGHTIRVAETALNAGGAGTGIASAPSQVVLPLPPVNTGAPRISGSPVEGQTVTEAQGSWSNGTTSVAEQWARCDSGGAACTAIPGATGQSYSITRADVDHELRVVEIARNAGGQGNLASSPATGVVDPASPRVKAALVRLSTARWRLRLRHLVRTGQATYHFSGPSAGRLTIVAKHGGRVVARGSTEVGPSGNGALVVRLTSPRRRLALPIKLQLLFRFAPAGGGQTTRSWSVTIGR